MKTFLRNILLELGLYFPILHLRGHNKTPENHIRFYQSFLTKEDLVFDVGANIGNRSEVFVSLARKVIAIEPQSGCIKFLKSRFKGNKRLVIEQVALSEREGEGVLYESDSHTLSSMSEGFIKDVGSTIFKANQWNTQVVVKTTTLDLLISKYGKPKFIKIDVEGFEENVLSGLSQAIPYISFEFTPSRIENAIVCLSKLHSLSSGYRFNYGLEEDLTFVLNQNEEYDHFLQRVIPVLATQMVFGDIYAILT